MALTGLILLANWFTGGYHVKLTLVLLDDAPELITRLVFALALLLLLPKNVAPDHFRLWWPALVVTTVVAALAGRALVYTAARALRRHGWVRPHPTLIVGSGHVASRLATSLATHPEYGLDVKGVVGDCALRDASGMAVPRLGGYTRLAAVVQDTGAHVVLIAFTSISHGRLVEAVRSLDRMPCEIFTVPRLYEVCGVGAQMDHVWGVPLVRLRRPVYRSVGWSLKRSLDLTLASLALVMLAPVMEICALAVRLDSRQSILFRQERLGVNGRLFHVLKFRTLTPADEDESSTRWNVSRDLRISAVGRVLRSTSLDELPQLFNVLAGDMSLVGPRPERPFFAKRFAVTLPGYQARHRVAPGITGWAQIHGLRGDTSIEDRASFDNYYIENWSLWNDIKIMIRTIPAMLRGG